jgi:hypothetical protein
LEVLDNRQLYRNPDELEPINFRPGKEEPAMAASPISIAPSANLRRRPLALTSRRLEANRRNAARSTGPRTAEGKARVGRNAIKHGFFAAQARWTPEQYRDFEQTLDGLRDDFKPQGVGEESCVWTMAHSYIRMAAVLRYENIAAARYHQDCERELNERIALAESSEAERLEARREQLRRAGIWGPTIPGPREAVAIARYQGKLDRAIRGALSDLQGLKSMRRAAGSNRKAEKQTHRGPHQSGKTNPLGGIADECPEAAEGPQTATSLVAGTAKTNPLTSMFTGNRHQRRRARALAARGRRPHP